MAIKTTQRAYTLRLKGMPGDDNWQEALWQTHLAVNKGVKAFGDWLLTLRGGLDHRLVYLPIPKPKKKDAQVDADAVRRHRRIILALSWLSVESADGAPPEHTVATGHDLDLDRQRKVVAAFRGILLGRGLKPAEVETWVADCKESLCAAIRDDAVWVNRSAAFDAAAKRIRSLTRNEACDLLSPFFVDAQSYLAPDKSSDDSEAAGESEKAKDLVQKAGQWLSSRFGEGEGADFGALSCAYARLAAAAKSARAGRSGSAVLASLARAALKAEPEDPLTALLESTSATGHQSATRNRLKKLAEKDEVDSDDLADLARLAEEDAKAAENKVGDKGHRPYADTLLKDAEKACGFTYLLKGGAARHWEFAVMLDHAARRVSVAHSWQKLAEARRQKFAADARRKAPADVEQWLDSFLEERARLTGAAGPMRIRRRAIDGWDDVVEAWTAKACKTVEDRKAAARELQDELEKFGDIQLFEALAADDAKCIWFRDDRPDPEPLRDYVLAHDAEAKMRRFKVPAYRHPDALLHPVFCDYGCSRWSISFAVHEAAQAVHRASDAVDKLSAAHGATTGEDARMKAHVRLLKARKALDAARAEFRSKLTDRGLTLKTANSGTLGDTALLWQSKRLAADLLPEQSPDGTGVSRADRLGRAAADAEASVLVRNVFEEEVWNGRLQAPRAQLDRLAARVRQHGWDSQADKMRRGLNWFITFSARLLPQEAGPWATLARALKLNENPVFWPHAAENKKREGHAKLVLSRLPGLRVLSVDLGHRYAAACAVWETLTEKQMAKACEESGRKAPKPDELAVHLLGKRDGRKVKAVYRRTGPDMWARLDRQFLIKLQGEDEPCRKASDDEYSAVAGFEAALGRDRTKDNPLPPDVVGLMSESIRSARLGLRRHGDRARIAFNLTTDHKPMPGGGREKLTDETRKELLHDTLMLWQGLFQNPNWQDGWAREMWNRHVRAELPAPPAEGAGRAERKAYDKRVRELLTDYAAKLAVNPSLRTKLHVLWATRWRKDDKQWVTHLRWLRNWLLPRGKAKSDASIRHVGGLSLDRLSNIRELWQVMKAYKTRPEPEDVRRNVPTKGDTSLDKYGQRVLDALEHMRENRVKQLASRIVEAALGIGSENRGHWQGGKRPRQLIPDPRFAQCHAVVTENLDLYRPEQTRTRRENRQLMRWSAAKILKYLAEACQLHGLHLREVHAGYTSRQDSRTGAPGIRCTDVPVAEFLRRHKARIAGLREKNDAVSQYLVALYDHWEKRSAKPTDLVRIPQDGGELFVSADRSSPAAKGIQADLNAAANIGLRALLDPDWPGKWWWIPCGKDGKPAREKCKGTEAFKLGVQLLSEDKDRKRDVTNAWRDLGDSGGWREYAPYWADVNKKVVTVLREQAKLR